MGVSREVGLQPLGWKLESQISKGCLPGSLSPEHSCVSDFCLTTHVAASSCQMFMLTSLF